MKSETRILTREYIAWLTSGGRYRFSSREAQEALSVSADAAKLALNRLATILPNGGRNLMCAMRDGFAVSDEEGAEMWRGLYPQGAASVR
jgi:hypothetical protein